MKLSFSTLACPDWTLAQIIAIASTAGYDGIELRFVQNEDSLWKLPVFSGQELGATKRALSDHGLTISCVDTSCRFHWPDANERSHWLTEGERMADLASALGAPGLRVFGDTVQPGADRSSTRSWIADSIRKLAEKTAPEGIEVWLETHGDFATALETAAILAEAGHPTTGAVWDPANCFVESQERPREGAAHLGASIRHVHIKDLCQSGDGWKLVLTGDGNFPLGEVRAALRQLGYDRFVSFEWERKWRPEIADAEIALPHFVRWFRENWSRENGQS
jgi:sugar phosphate isomerase/epimerase